VISNEELKKLIWIYNELIDKYPLIYKVLKEQYEKRKGE
jgi:hypothetical protein